MSLKFNFGRVNSIRLACAENNLLVHWGEEEQMFGRQRENLNHLNLWMTDQQNKPHSINGFLNPEHDSRLLQN